MQRGLSSLKAASMEIVTEQEGEVYLGNQRTTDEMNRKELGEYIERFSKRRLKVLSFVVDYHLKLALPMASFVFALCCPWHWAGAGAPLGLS